MAAASAWLHGSANMRMTESLISVLKEERPQYIPALLASYREHGGVSAHSSSAIGGLVGLCNARLGTSKTRFEGLCMLSVLVKDSTSEVFQQQCLTWLRSLQQVIQSQVPLPTVQLAVEILQDVLQYSSQLAELAREVGLNSILGILTSLMGLKSECHLVAMEGMKACMTFYPRACGSLRDKLAAYFLSKMDSDNPKIQEVACECYGWLPGLGGVLERSGAGRRAEVWACQLHCLLATAHSILEQLYQGAESDGTLKYEGSGVELPFSPLDEVDPLLFLQLQHRYRAVCLAIKHTLSIDPSSPVRLPVQSLLNLVCRALAVSGKSMSVTGDGCLQLLVLPSVHNTTLGLLSALISTVGAGLVQYAGILTRLFSQTLSAWSPQPEAGIGQQRAYSAVRVTLYHTLELWVRVGGVTAGILQGSPAHTQLLMAHLLADVTPGVDSVKLRTSTVAVSELLGHGGKAGSRRAKGLAESAMPSQQRKGDTLANQDTCLSALRALRQIVLINGTLLKEDIHKKLHELVLPLCVRLQQQQCSADPGVASGPYCSAPARRELYRLLLGLVLVPPPRWAPPLSCAVSIFSQGRRDRSLTVSSFCAEALAICNALLHPRVPSIALPLPPIAVKQPPAAPAPTLAPSQSASLSLPCLLSTPGQPSAFPSRLPLGLLAPVENHLPLSAPVLPPTPVAAAAGPGELLLSPHPQTGELPVPEGHRPVFVRYDKEEAEDVEISLESDSDDSVVIVPPGMLTLDAQDGSAPTTASGHLQSTTAGESAPITSPLPNEHSTTMVHPMLPPASNALSAFTTQSPAQLMSLVPQLNSNPTQLPPPSSNVGDALPGTQLQQMLLQPPPIGQSAQMALPVQMQLQNQLSQSSRPPQQQATEEDLTVININSSDEEEEEDDEEVDEDELGDEEEEDEDEEDGSDFPEEYYDGEEDIDEYEEEEEGMMEEEEEEDGEELPQIEGQTGSTLGAEGAPLVGPVDEGAVGIFRVEGRQEEEGAPVEEEEDEEEEEEEVAEIYSADMRESQEDEDIGVAQEQMSTNVVAEDVSSEILRDLSEHETHAEPGKSKKEVTSKEEEPQEKEEPPVLEETSAPSQALNAVGEPAEPEQSQGQAMVLLKTECSTEEKPEHHCPGQVEHLAEGDGVEESEDERGTKRKLEECEQSEAEQSVEKKQCKDEAMASMLADFVDCPPDDEENPRCPIDS